MRGDTTTPTKHILSKIVNSFGALGCKQFLSATTPLPGREAVPLPAGKKSQ